MNDVKDSGTAVATVMVENNRTRVTEWRFPGIGDNTGWHRHEYDYVVVPMFDGVLEIADETGKKTRAELRNGIPYYRDRGVEHDVVSANDFECAFIEIEFLKS